MASVDLSFDLKGAFKKGGSYAIQIKKEYPPEAMAAIIENFNRVADQLGVKFIMITPNFEILNVEELFNSRQFKDRLETLMREILTKTWIQ